MDNKVIKFGSNATVEIKNLSIGYVAEHNKKVIANNICANINRGELT